MSGNYPDGLNQASFDQYWNEKLDDIPEYEIDETPDDLDLCEPFHVLAIPDDEEFPNV
jgi:hypothetical protein